MCAGFIAHNTAELNLPLEHWVRFETRPPGLEERGEISMDALVKNALRMRPDRIIVGEVRHAEAFTLFTAINTGHDGCLGSVHANSAQETLIRVMSPPMSVPPVMIDALDFIVMEQKIVDRRKGTIRRITEIAEVTGVVDDKPQLQLLWEWDPATDTTRATAASSRYEQKLMRFTGLSRSDIALELERRAGLLADLAARGVRAMPAVIAELRAYEGRRS